MQLTCINVIKVTNNEIQNTQKKKNTRILTCGASGVKTPTREQNQINKRVNEKERVTKKNRKRILRKKGGYLIEREMKEEIKEVERIRNKYKFNHKEETENELECILKHYLINYIIQ